MFKCLFIFRFLHNLSLKLLAVLSFLSDLSGVLTTICADMHITEFRDSECETDCCIQYGLSLFILSKFLEMNAEVQNWKYRLLCPSIFYLFRGCGSPF